MALLGNDGRPLAGISRRRAQWQLLEEVDGAGQPTYTLRGALGDKGFLQAWVQRHRPADRTAHL